MQPNNMQPQPAMMPMQAQPNQPAPQATAPINYQTTPISQPQKKKGHLSIILAILFCMTTLGLAAYIIVDKVINNKAISDEIFISTFHSFCSRLLRNYVHELKY